MSFLNRIKKNFKHFNRWAKKQNTNAFRLYDRDIPDFPFIIDIYNKHAIIYYLAKDYDLKGSKSNHLEEVQNSLKEICHIPKEKQFIKIRNKQKGILQYNKISKESFEFTVNEGNAVFLINGSDYLDCGLFLDHRPIRKIIFEFSKNKKLLNLFCYTASISVQAALGGAQTTNVDLSATYLQWAKKNFELNHLDIREHDFINQNTIDFLKEDKTLYNMIFVDPPTFSNSKKMESDFEVERDHKDLIIASMKKLRPDGHLYFSTNKTTFTLDGDLKNRYKVKDISLKSIPDDFRNKKIHYCFEFKNR